MILVLFLGFLLIGLGLLIWNCWVDHDTMLYFVCGTFGIILLMAAVAMFITLMCLIPKVATEQKYEERIELVEENNARVEGQICSVVETYLRHEENIYENIDVTTAIGLFSAYPNLKSNELVQSLINTYQANTAEIKALKLEKVELKTIKFLVYFGH